ncbi:MAG: methyltransferase domain-containing protein [Campylobacterota bacterium]|nr:methyltransferase domain-containing protein [Campylobacterota bacterium]
MKKREIMKVAKEFSRFAKAYNRHNIIQAEVAKKLVAMLPGKYYERIFDLGCGRGEVYRNLNGQGVAFGHLTAMDISSEMLALHPDTPKIARIRGDFNQPETFDALPFSHYDLLLSASALQWSSDLDVTLQALCPLSKRSCFAIFTAGTFRTLHTHAGITSPIFDEDFLKEKLRGYFDAEFETVRYKLHFDTVYEMLRYIKESGTSGGERHLGYRQTKQLLDEYPLDYLEFEVLFVEAIPYVY